jgi:hypothetical protein
MPGIPQKPKWAVTRIIQFQKLAKKNNQWKPNIFYFSLIPNRITTTKLDQKWEKQPKPMKTMFNSWVTEKTKIWRYILALLDPIWLYLKIMPQFCKDGNLSWPFAHNYLGLLIFFILSKIISKSHISHWILGMIYFFEVKYCQNNILLFWGMLTGNIFSRYPSYYFGVYDLFCRT